jgi:hypothetical protein
VSFFTRCAHGARICTTSLRALWTAWNDDQASPQKAKAESNKKANRKTKKNAKQAKTDGQ